MEYPYAVEANDDLGSNPFFRKLQTTYGIKYREAQKNQWMICVPHRNTLENTIINKEFVELHILKPSPFFKSHYDTTDDNNSMHIEMEESTLKTPSGVVKILDEEAGYNDNFKPFKILIIERPLDCSSKFIDDSYTNSIEGKGYITSLNECRSVLLSFRDSDILSYLETKMYAFNYTYMVLPQYLNDAVVKLRDIRQYAVERYLRALEDCPDKYSKTKVITCVENYILMSVHNKLFSVIKKRCLEDDRKLTEKLFCLHEANVTADQLGVEETFCCPTPTAVVELASLNSRCSPAEKLHCLVTTLESLNQDVERYVAETCFIVSANDFPHMASDELIPLLVTVIIQARPQYFVSNLYYIQNFCWEMTSVDKFSFALVTFQAAKEFIMSHDFNLPESSTRKIKKELSLEELMEVTVEFQNNSKSSSGNKPVINQSPLDHQLENVTKMIEASTSDLQDKKPLKGSVLYGKERRAQMVKQEENLGDFITSLRQKSLGLTYGKQT